MNNMKLMKIMKLGIIFLGSLLFGISFAHSQTFIVSNLDQPNSGPSSNANSGLWRATSFTTGSEETTLQSMVTRLQNFDGGNEFVSIYSNSVTNSPNSEVISFLDDPVDLMTDDRFQFTPDGTFTLSADTTYWMVFGVNGSGEFKPYRTISFGETGSTGWSIGNTGDSSEDGGNTWPNSSQHIAYQFGIIVPETSTYIFASGMCLVAFAMFRRIRIAKSSK